MDEDFQAWFIAVVLVLFGFFIGWLVFDPDEEPAPPADVRLAAQCYRDYDAYVRQQVEWLQKHNDELRTVIELDSHNNEVKGGAVEKQF